MKTMSYTEPRARYAEVLDAVINDREEVIVTRAGHDPVIIVSLEDYESLRELANLMAFTHLGRGDGPGSPHQPRRSPIGQARI